LTVLVVSIFLPAAALAAVPVAAAAGGVAGVSTMGLAALGLGIVGITGFALYGALSGQLGWNGAAKSVGVGIEQPLLRAIDGKAVDGWTLGAPSTTGEGKWLVSAQKGSREIGWEPGGVSGSRSLAHFQDKTILADGTRVSNALDHWPGFQFPKGSTGSKTLQAMGKAAESSTFRAAARGVGRVAIVAAVALDAYFIYNAYKQDGNRIGANTAVAVGASAGGWIGAAAGAVIGQALIPIPVVGAVIGAAAGAFIGSMAGEAVAKFSISAKPAITSACNNIKTGAINLATSVNKINTTVNTAVSKAVSSATSSLSSSISKATSSFSSSLSKSVSNFSSSVSKGTSSLGSLGSSMSKGLSSFSSPVKSAPAPAKPAPAPAKSAPAKSGGGKK
jgi:hypothetical protein